MAKKTAKKAPASKTAAKKASKKKPATKKSAEPMEIVLSPAEEKALQLVDSSAKLRKELELAVTEAVSGAVLKVFGQHKIPLTPPQAEQLALVLFAD